MPMIASTARHAIAINTRVAITLPAVAPEDSSSADTTDVAKVARSKVKKVYDILGQGQCARSAEGYRGCLKY